MSVYLPNRPPGPTPAVCSGPAAFTRSSGNHPHKDALCLCAWRQTASRGHGTRAGQRACPGAKSPGPACPAHLPRKGHPTVPWLNMGVPSAAHNAHPHRNQPLGAGAPDRGAQAVRQKFALSPAGGAKHPSARLLARPISWAAERGGSSTTRSPLVQSTTCLGLHLVTGSMISDFTARWARSQRRSAAARACGCPLRALGVRSSLHGRG